MLPKVVHFKLKISEIKILYPVLLELLLEISCCKSFSQKLIVFWAV